MTPSSPILADVEEIIEVSNKRAVNEVLLPTCVSPYATIYTSTYVFNISVLSYFAVQSNASCMGGTLCKQRTNGLFDGALGEAGLVSLPDPTDACNHTLPLREGSGDI